MGFATALAVHLLESRKYSRNNEQRLYTCRLRVLFTTTACQISVSHSVVSDMNTVSSFAAFTTENRELYLVHIICQSGFAKLSTFEDGDTGTDTG